MTPEEELKEIKTKRGEIITNFAYVELEMSRVIARHYAQQGKAEEKLREDILEDEYFSFGLRKHIFKKVIEEYYKNSKFPFGKLTGLERIRNIIGHASIRNVSEKSAEIHTLQENPFYWHNGYKHDCKKLHEDYDKLKDEVIPTLNDLTRSKVIAFSNIKKKNESNGG